MKELLDDGAEYHCGHKDHGPDRVKAVICLTMEEWKELKPQGFQFRALCPKHKIEAEDWLKELETIGFQFE